MMLLHHLQQAGALEDLTLEEIGHVIGVNRSTICRDLQELPFVLEEYRYLMASQPWIKRHLTVPEFADRIGADPQTVRFMIRDGLIRAIKADNRIWYIRAAELDWWLRER